MAGPGLPGLALVLAVLLPLPPPPGLPLPPENAAPSLCPPDQFQCAPGERCFARDWLCDGHPDCEDEEDEQDCGTATPAEPSPGGPALTSPWSSAGPPAGSAEASATPEPGVSVPSRSQGYTWILIVAGLLSILVAASSVAVWGLFKAKSRSNTVNLEKASREQLMSDKSQTGSFP
ncbi:CD320 antigen [Neopelma chrysocephalum]|uniref:CD320 antigen n=1 Tax=Neopelma chrysocephalum TaxID=114329 RepID=UPI000FCCF4DE|nr:CD320 antigen [Neopelma chrysocephalum]